MLKSNRLITAFAGIVAAATVVALVISTRAAEVPIEQQQFERIRSRMVMVAPHLGLPVGSVVAFAGPKIPGEWLPCDGRAVSQRDYPALFAAVGEAYGRGPGDGEFRVPDYRGQFLRGAGKDRAVGAREGFATALPTKGWAVNVEAAGEHSHGVDMGGGRLVTFRQVPGRAQPNGDCTPPGLKHRDGWIDGRWPACIDFGVAADGKHQHAATMTGGDGESRPANVAVVFIIKARSASIPTPDSGALETQVGALTAGITSLAQGADTPVGTVQPFAGVKIPAGWLACDGQLLSRRDYPDLYAVIGDIYGQGDNDQFHLPNYGDLFLRGVDPDKTVDKDRDSRQAPTEGSKAAHFLGSRQGFATAAPGAAWKVEIKADGEHNHDLQKNGGRAVALTNGGDNATEDDDGKGEEPDNRWDQCRDIKLVGDGKHTHKATVAGGDGETRPANVAVAFIIKARPARVAKDSAGTVQDRLRLVSVGLVEVTRDLDVPIGTVSSTAMTIQIGVEGDGLKTSPTVWLPCDGRVVKRQVYPALFAAIGEAYGRGPGDGEFRVPDYRGQFLRGAGKDRAVGAREGFATALPTKGWAVNVEAAGEHSHGVTGGGRAVRFTGGFTVDNPDGWGNEWCHHWNQCVGFSVAKSGNHAHAAEVTGGDTETHPVNVAVNFYIKAAEVRADTSSK